jgi:hypothetical protein
MATTTQDKIRDTVITALDDVLNSRGIYTGEFLAEKFADARSDIQADFFNCLANIVNAWEMPHILQWRYMQDHLTPEGKELLNDMKIHTDNN